MYNATSTSKKVVLTRKTKNKYGTSVIVFVCVTITEKIIYNIVPN